MNVKELQEKYGKGVIGITSYYLGRYREFDICKDKIIAPTGSIIEWELGMNVAVNFNNLIKKMLKSDFQWLWILGDDHVFRPDLLVKLLEREVDMVTPFCLRRAKPFDTVVHTGPEDKYHRVGRDWFAGKTGLLDMTDFTIGNAGALIKRRVFEAIPAPWLESGKTHPEVGGSDLYFCQKVKGAGFKHYLDLDNMIGHITHAAAWPKRNADGTWGWDLFAPTEEHALIPDANDPAEWTAIFNDYRKNYDRLEYDRHRKLYDVLAEKFPDQRRFRWPEVREVLQKNQSKRVFEIGGWKGELAEIILPLKELSAIEEWRNIEISPKAVEGSVCKNEKYHAEVLDDFIWNKPEVLKGYDTLILSHVVEHWRLDQFKKLIENLNGIKAVYIDAPIPESKDTVDWQNYCGTHVIDAGWDELDAAMRETGFITKDDGTARMYVKQ